MLTYALDKKLYLEPINNSLWPFKYYYLCSKSLVNFPFKHFSDIKSRKLVAFEQKINK